MMSTVEIEGQNGLFTPPMFSKFYNLKTIKEKERMNPRLLVWLGHHCLENFYLKR